MKYTIDGPDQAIDATVTGDFDVMKIALLVHLPGADARTAAMFGRHAAKTWLRQPQYATFEITDGAAVIRWDGKVVDIDTAEDLKTVIAGRLKLHGTYQWALDTNAHLVDTDDR